MAEERREIQRFIAEENRRLLTEHIFLDLVVWEELKHSFHGKRVQDYFNEKMLECDVVICMFGRRVGDFSKEEFDRAYENFKRGGKPRYLYVFFKDEKVRLSDIDRGITKILDLREKIAEAEQIYNNFKSSEDLILQLTGQFQQHVIPELTEK